MHIEYKLKNCSRQNIVIILCITLLQNVARLMKAELRIPTEYCITVRFKKLASHPDYRILLWISINEEPRYALNWSNTSLRAKIRTR